ncbi:MAG TPA: endolytic transglycosylase MltG [Xanthomonadales bacterium]|nr:endolytic transglycosylase MltG [Xanthomonadales bacterium]
MSAGRKRLFRWLGLSLLLAAIAVAAGLGWLRLQYEEFLQQPLDIAPEGQVFVVEPGKTGRAVIMDLQDAGVSQFNWQWRWLMRQQQLPVKAGEYRLEPGFTPLKLLKVLQSGDVIHYRFTVVEGWTVAQLLAALQDDPMLGASVPDVEALARLSRELTQADNPEGWFLPETYQFVRGYTAADLLKRAYLDMQSALSEAWESRSVGHPVQTPYELLVLASIIERETAVESERGEISGVFVRRLLKGMRLQTDPTVIYGLGESFDGDIRKKDLQTDTPYNTYTRFGLPPTPIALPGVASLQAAAQPQEGTSLYFVANGQGGHTFSDTFEEHQKAVNVLLGRKP